MLLSFYFGTIQFQILTVLYGLVGITLDICVCNYGVQCSTGIRGNLYISIAHYISVRERNFIFACRDVFSDQVFSFRVGSVFRSICWSFCLWNCDTIKFEILAISNR